MLVRDMNNQQSLSNCAPVSVEVDGEGGVRHFVLEKDEARALIVKLFEIATVYSESREAALVSRLDYPDR